MREEIKKDSVHRFDELYRAEYPGERAYLLSALSVLQAMERAAKHYGVTPEEFKRSGRLSEPTTEDAEKYCLDRGCTVSMTVFGEFGSVTVNAICRKDAILQAAKILHVSAAALETPRTRVKTTNNKMEEAHNVSSSYNPGFIFSRTYRGRRVRRSVV